MMWLHKAIATVLGLGYAPKAPGTFGTLGAVLLLVLSKLFSFSLSLNVLTIIILIAFTAGVYSTNKLIKEWGESDPQRVVIDEFVGLLITVLWIPLSWTNIMLAFVLFRIFDIWKPLGIKTLDQRIKGGMGVMIDDVLAGIYACIVLHLINYFI